MKKQYGILRKPEIRKFIKSEIAKSNESIDIDGRFSAFYVKQFDRYVLISNRTHAIVSDARGYGFKSVESAKRLLKKFLEAEILAQMESDYAGYSIYDL